MYTLYTDTRDTPIWTIFLTCQTIVNFQEVPFVRTAMGGQLEKIFFFEKE